jgi:hypothetical protein
MAKKIGVGESTYRMWETGTENYAGPTHQQAKDLNRTLLPLLGDAYSDGQALGIWGWPVEWELSFSRFAEIMRSAGLAMPHLQGVRPSAVLWVQRLREPNLVHGVLAMAAAAATRVGLSVHLLLDDTNLSQARRQVLRDEFFFRLSGWFEFAAGNRTLLTSAVYSDILTGQVLEQRAWAAICGYLNAKSSVLEYLLASKALSPIQYNTDADQSVLELVRQTESLKADRLITPIRNWIVFEQEITRLTDRHRAGNGLIVTLGGEDERVLWELWHRGCAEELSERVYHIYLRPIPMPSYRVPWQEPALTTKTNRPWLASYLRNRMTRDGNTDITEWILNAAVSLPAALNSEYHAGLPDSLARPAALFSQSADQLAEVVPAVAEAVVRWLVT